MNMTAGQGEKHGVIDLITRQTTQACMEDVSLQLTSSHFFGSLTGTLLTDGSACSEEEKAYVIDQTKTPQH